MIDSKTVMNSVDWRHICGFYLTNRCDLFFIEHVIVIN